MTTAPRKTFRARQMRGNSNMDSGCSFLITQSKK
jgi:hypothetical protein